MTAKKSGGRWFMKPATLLLVGVLSITLLPWISFLDKKQHSYINLTNTITTMHISIVTSHLWLEEYLAEDDQTNLQNTTANLLEALRLSRVILEGGEAERGIVLSPLDIPSLRTPAEAIAGKLVELQAIAELRLFKQRATGPGSDLDEKYDELFMEIQGKVNEFNELAETLKERNNVQTTHLYYTIFIVWSLIVAAATIAMWFHESQRNLAEKKRDQLVQEVASVNRELNDFAIIISHEMRAPLRAIGSLAGWLVTDYADKFDEQGKERANLLISRVRLLDSLVSRIFEYSRAGLANEERSKVNFNHLVAKVIDMLTPPKNIKIIVEGALPSVVCQKTRFEEVFHNLLGNAIKFMDKPAGEIRVGCVGEDEYWKFSVADNGPGIEEKYFEKIFKLFETLNSRATSESTGFGLALVKKIVESYGGRVWVESTIGQGSIFYFTISRNTVDDTR